MKFPTVQYFFFLYGHKQRRIGVKGRGWGIAKKVVLGGQWSSHSRVWCYSCRLSMRGIEMRYLDGHVLVEKGL
jgi:hypothetical protein